MHLELIAAVTAGSVVDDIGRSLREAFSMFWDTLWALVLGFGLSGAVQAFADRDALRATLGDHRPPAVTRASLFGMVSSSCSYAASAMARSLIARGADFVAAMVFMFASTNLVVELGIVLLVLIGWQFLAAEFIGGIIMIVLLTLGGTLWLRGRALDRALQRVQEDTGDARHHHGSESTPAARGEWRRRARTAAGWSEAASYTMSDLGMLRREMAIGFLVAGFLTVLVPVSVWNAVFLHGHGIWTTIENAVVGPFVAIISFVCSVGNVALAAALWKGGISFGGVVSFIFADLITLPLLLIYAKQYGRRMALRMLGLFWLVMSLSGLATEGIFRLAGWLPTTRPAVVADHAMAWNATTVLDILAIVAFGILYWLHRNRDRFGGGEHLVTDPACGMQVDERHAPAALEHGGQTISFCSTRCRDRYRQALATGGDGGSGGQDRPVQ